MPAQDTESTKKTKNHVSQKTRALVLHPFFTRHSPKGLNDPSRSPESCLEEACGLAAAIDLEITDAEILSISTVQPATLFGKGQKDRLAETIKGRGVNLVFVNGTLSPIQQRNLEKAWNIKVIDRTGLILEIFGARARTREGILQVELASLNYLRSRLVRTWTHLERQRGGHGFLGGPGESQLEVDRRLIDKKIVKLKTELAHHRATRKINRASRERNAEKVIALVGYTNAGKSTLFNRLTGATVLAKDLLFATLDPTLKRARLPNGKSFILSDTVGFIADLPTHLVEAFKATLEEVQNADVILHVRDVAHPETEEQKRDVYSVLEQLGITEDDPRILEVLNKIDRLDDERRAILTHQLQRKKLVALSALTGEGMETLFSALQDWVSEDEEILETTLAHAEGANLAWLYAHGKVLERKDTAKGTRLKVSLTKANLGRYIQQVEKDRMTRTSGRTSRKASGRDKGKQ